MKCQRKSQRLAVRHRGEPLLWLCCRTICTSTNSAMHDLHTISSVAL